MAGHQTCLFEALVSQTARRSFFPSTMDSIDMKRLFAIAFLLCSSLFWSTSASAAAVTGTVLQVQEVESYTYLQLKTGSGEVWAAVTKAQVKKGATVTVENATQMTNFESKSLKKTFPVIFFGTLAGAATAGTAPAPKAAAVADVKVAKASGPDARTVAELVSKIKELKDKSVVLHAQVVKYNAGIMGKNWVHLRDGSGSATDGSNDILATTADQVKVGDVVTFKGMLRKDKDFGSGYSYKALIEDAKLQK